MLARGLGGKSSGPHGHAHARIASAASGNSSATNPSGSVIHTGNVGNLASNTLHVNVKGATLDRGDVYLHFCVMPGFEVIGLYDCYVFVRFSTPEQALKAHQASDLSAHGIQIEIARQDYQIPYPQPDAEPISMTLHVTHLPVRFTPTEMSKFFQRFKGFFEAQYFEKYAYVIFLDEECAVCAHDELRDTTNLVVSFSKHIRTSAITKAAPAAAVAATTTQAGANVRTVSPSGMVSSYGMPTASSAGHTTSTAHSQLHRLNVPPINTTSALQYSAELGSHSDAGSPSTDASFVGRYSNVLGVGAQSAGSLLSASSGGASPRGNLRARFGRRVAGPSGNDSPYSDDGHMSMSVNQGMLPVMTTLKAPPGMMSSPMSPSDNSTPHPRAQIRTIPTDPSSPVVVRASGYGVGPMPMGMIASSSPNPPPHLATIDSGQMDMSMMLPDDGQYGGMVGVVDMVGILQDPLPLYPPSNRPQSRPRHPPPGMQNVYAAPTMQQSQVDTPTQNSPVGGSGNANPGFGLAFHSDVVSPFGPLGLGFRHPNGLTHGLKGSGPAATAATAAIAVGGTASLQHCDDYHALAGRGAGIWGAPNQSGPSQAASTRGPHPQPGTAPNTRSGSGGYGRHAYGGMVYPSPQHGALRIPEYPSHPVLSIPAAGSPFSESGPLGGPSRCLSSPWSVFDGILYS
ncbi:hypothetical protein CXG81DRAFT_19388 [Caulochytrium protostelioides]|uniref:RRM domain-containing protein n=1 Tax=Caulochytrium protostelioides TaxID=1555241 RepID=A0A4P9WWL4_9FUNG|nr:hypothetical protein CAUPRSCDRAFT_11217 [Caulochytrium protostelioides]RKP00701.1 hypothetical protein CXG81DRAFT_19388 [Caulochytrium protostelioides]|eukprot:RKP00701.1 hypothetical protein CXG81DRAFT_19388 [Caulochytrium protostelioides]